MAIVRARLATDAVLGSEDPSFGELHRIQLPGGNTVLVLTRQLPETSEYHQYIRTRFLSHYEADTSQAGRTYGELPVGNLGPNVRALIWDGTKSEKYWHEVSARKLVALGGVNGER